MWSMTQLCRCSQGLRVAQSKLLVASTRNSLNTGVVSRHLITPSHNVRNSLGLQNYKGFRLSQVIKSNGIVMRLCSSSPKPKTSKAVGYWLLGCSGMVFTAVVLGMVAGYLTLLYSIYYVINLILTTTNNSK